MNINIIKYQNIEPKIDKSVKLALSSIIIGNTIINKNTAIGDSVVIRGDGECISIGKNCTLKSASTVHVASNFLGTKIGDNCIIEKYCVIHACELGNGVLVGENSVIMDGSIVGNNSIILPNTLVPPRKIFKKNSLIGGAPAKLINNIDLKLYDTYLNKNSKKSNENMLLSDVSYTKHIKKQELSFKKLNKIEDNIFIATDIKYNCKLTMQSKSSIWFAVNLHSTNETGEVFIDEGSNVQDNTIINTEGKRVNIGKRVTIGHNVIINGNIEIEDDVVIGIGSILEENCVIKKNAFIGAHSFVKKNTIVPEGQIYAGKPASFFRNVTEKEKAYFSNGQKIYLELSSNYLKELT